MKTLFLLCLLALNGLAQQIDFETIIKAVNTHAVKWRAGHNFNETTSPSSLKMLLGVKGSPNIIAPRKDKWKIHIPDSKIPEEFDARKKWPQCKSIGHISDQGSCGSCWAIAASGAFTDRLCIATNGSFTQQLSAQEVLSCCHTCGNGCNGGYIFEAWKFFAYNGIVTGGDYKSNQGCQPYQINGRRDRQPLYNFDYFFQYYLPQQGIPTPWCETQCTNPLYFKPYSFDHHKTHWPYKVSNDVKEIQKEILAYGPVAAVYTVYEDFYVYKSGVYGHVTGARMGNHAVKIIGWGVEDDTPYWLVANEWSEAWGENGFFRIQRGNNECEIESYIFAGIPKTGSRNSFRLGD